MLPMNIRSLSKAVGIIIALPLLVLVAICYLFILGLLLLYRGLTDFTRHIRTKIRERNRRNLDKLISAEGVSHPFPVLFHILKYHGCSRPEDVRTLIDSADESLSYDVLHFLNASILRSCDRFIQTPATKYFLDDPKGQVNETVLKKMAVFAENVALFRPYRFLSELTPDGRPGKQDPTIAEVSREFFEDTFRFQAFLRAGLLWILPNEIMTGVQAGQLALTSLEIVKNKRIGLTHEQLRAQLCEDSTEIGLSLLYLPHMQNVPTDLLIKIRQDEGDAFLRFQHGLAAFLQKSQAANSEAALLDCMREVDYNIRLLDVRFRNLRKMRALRTRNIAIQLCSLALVQLAPAPIAADLTKLLGSLTAFSVLEYFAGFREKADQLKESDFYFPWRIAHG
jgi:hypothetical protein